jgi:NitT/TauT family transport system substrate-binding protein
MSHAYRARKRRTMVAALIAVAAGAGLTACGSSSSSGDSSAGAGSGTAKQKTYSITVADPSPIVDFAPLYIAQQQGLFKKEGVDVKILTGPVTNTVSFVVSGQADLAMFTPAVALQTAAKGEDVKAIYGGAALPNGALMSSPKIKTIADAQKLGSCKLATASPGSLTYANAVAYKKALGLKCDLAIVPTIPALAAGVQSGQYQLATGVLTTALQVQKAGGHLLLDPRTAAFKAKYEPKPQYPETVLFGVGKHLSQNREAIVRFLKAFHEAEAALAGGQTSDQLAKSLLQDPVFKGQAASLLTTNLSFLKSYFNAGFGGGPGFIGPGAWSTMLQALSGWSLPNYDPSAGTNAYDQRVDMSYYNAAVGNG